MRISDWSSDVCSSDLRAARIAARDLGGVDQHGDAVDRAPVRYIALAAHRRARGDVIGGAARGREIDIARIAQGDDIGARFERAGIDGGRRHPAFQIGRASGRERVCQYVSISVVAVSLKKKKYT